MRDLPLFQLPDIVSLSKFGMWHLYHVVVVVDLKELMDDKLVVGLVRVVKRLDVLQDLLHLLDALCRTNP